MDMDTISFKDGNVSDTTTPLGSPEIKRSTFRAIDPNCLNLRQLRVELKRMGLSPSGLKAELRRRLKAAWGVDSSSPSASDDETSTSNTDSSRPPSHSTSMEDIHDNLVKQEDADEVQARAIAALNKRKRGSSSPDTSSKIGAVGRRKNMSPKRSERKTSKVNTGNWFDEHWASEDNNIPQDLPSPKARLSDGLAVFFEVASLELYKVQQQR
jgi:hypothetical protein